MLPCWVASTEAAAAFSSDARGLHRLLIVGLGRVGTHVAEQALDSQRFERIVGTVRKEPGCPGGGGVGGGVVDDASEKAETAPPGLHWSQTLGIASGEKAGQIERCWFDELSATLVESSTHILFTMPAPDPAAWATIEHVVLPALRGTSSLHNRAPDREERREDRLGRWVGVLSTTGVYGNHEGAIVTEDSDCLCDPDSSAGRLLDVENRWRDLVQEEGGSEEEAATVQVRVFRSAGIYGPTRSALHTAFRNGVPPVPNRLDASILSTSGLAEESSLRQHDVTNRIHEADLAAAILASMLVDESDNALPHFRVYNVADDLPESRRTVMEYAATLLREEGVDVPEAEEGPPSRLDSVGRSRRRTIERKLVSNDRLKEELLPSLQFPTYREGLAHVLHHSEAPWRPSLRKAA